MALSARAIEPACDRSCAALHLLGLQRPRRRLRALDAPRRSVLAAARHALRSSRPDCGDISGIDPLFAARALVGCSYARRTRTRTREDERPVRGTLLDQPRRDGRGCAASTRNTARSGSDPPHRAMADDPGGGLPWRDAFPDRRERL